MTDTQTETISLLAYELESERLTRKIRNICIGWAGTVAIFAASMITIFAM